MDVQSVVSEMEQLKEFFEVEEVCCRQKGSFAALREQCNFLDAPLASPHELMLRLRLHLCLDFYCFELSRFLV